MMRLHHRLPQAAVVGVAHQVERDGAEILQRAGQPGVGNVAGRDGRRGGRIRHVAGGRKLGPDALRERRQRRRRRRQARAAKGVEPAGALAQLAGKRMARVLAGAQGNGEPVKRARIEMAKADLHACAIQEPDHLYKCGTLKDTG